MRSDLRKIDAVLSEMLAITRSNKEIFRCMEENLQCLEPLLGELSCEEAVMENGLATEDIDGDLPLGFEKATTFESADLTGDDDSSEIDLLSANYSVVVLPSHRSLSWCRPSAQKLGNGRTGLHLLKMKISKFSARQRKLQLREALYLYHLGLMEDTVGTWMV